MTATAQRRADRAVAWAIVLGTVAWLLAVEGRQGIGRDEAQYFRAAERYWGWYEASFESVRRGRLREVFDRATIEAHFGDNPEHPPLMKILYGVSWRLFHRCECMGPERALHPIPARGRHVTLPLFPRESTAFRLPAILLAGLGAALLFLFARSLLGRAGAVGAAALSVAQPHYFFHAQIAAFDAPITTINLAVAFAWWKSLRQARWGLFCGPLFGLALATKHNAWLSPVLLCAHYLWVRRTDLRRLRPPRPPLALVSMLVAGPLVCFALWPWLWPDPAGRTRTYFLRHLQHEHYNFEYLGRNWNLPPKHADLRLMRATFPFVSTACTVPAITLVLACVGAVALARRRTRVETPPATAPEPAAPTLLSDARPSGYSPSWLRPARDVDRAPGAFLAVQVLGPMLVMAVPSVPIFGGVKHFLPAMPLLAVVAGVGLRKVAAVVASFTLRERARRLAPWLLLAAVTTPALIETHRSHPDGLGHYNFCAGGFAGGASLGMNRQFWGYSVLPMLPWMVSAMPASRQVYWHDVLHDALVMYMRDGRLPLGIGNTGVGEEAVARSDLGIVVHEKHFALYEGLFWQSYGTTRPAYVLTRQGVPLVTAYLRRQGKAP